MDGEHCSKVLHSYLQEPHECGAYDSRCGSWLAQWTIGIEGKTCTYNDTGIRFGKNSYKYMSIQIHWNNNNFDKDYKGKNTTSVRFKFMIAVLRVLT